MIKDFLVQMASFSHMHREASQDIDISGIVLFIIGRFP